MASRQRKTTTTTTRTYTVSHVCRILSLVAVLIMGLGIAIGVVFGWIDALAAVGARIKEIAIAIGLIAICWYSYYEARTRGTTWLTLWLVAVILIGVFYIAGIIVSLF